MRIRTWLTIVIVAVVVLAAALGIATQFELGGLRIVAMVAVPAAAAVVVMIVKNHSLRITRAMEPGSVEREHDLKARAGAFNDAAVSAALAMVLGVLVPDLQAWTIALVLLSLLASCYWVRRSLLRRGNRYAGR